MINILDIIQTLAPCSLLNITTTKQSKILSNKQIDKVEFTNFESLSTFTNFFSCLLYQYMDIKIETNNDYDQISFNELNLQIDKLKKYMEDNTFNQLINIKKLINLINQNMINNELILFLSGYFNINIFLYSFENKLLKIYYLEDKLYIEKKSVIIILKKDILKPDVGYQSLKERIIYKYSDKFIQDLCDDIYIIPVGLIENKKLITSIQQENNNFIESILDISPKILVIDDNIFDNNISLEDDDKFKYPIFEYNIKKMIKKYTKDKMMKLINIYYKNNII